MDGNCAVLTSPAGATPRRWRAKLLSFFGTVGLFLAFLFATAIQTEAFQLVTPEEAALPAGRIPEIDVRSPTRRPDITVVSPSPKAGVMHSPLDLKVRFRAFGGAEIDPDSVIVTYVKEPAIDITQRIKPYITAGGIDVSQADLPPGKHQFWVEVMDNEGRINGLPFSVQIAK